MKIDTEIHHVTKPGANLFLELGFTPEEARRLQTASGRQINDTRLLKQQLMEELSVWIPKHHLKQAEAAEILMVSRPRVSDVVNKKTAKFTIDTPGGNAQPCRQTGQAGDQLMQCLERIIRRFWRICGWSPHQPYRACSITVRRMPLILHETLIARWSDEESHAGRSTKPSET
jgi:predicted XRE-type DNA-binding protein